MRELTRGRLLGRAAVGGVVLLTGGPVLAGGRAAAAGGDAGRVRTALALAHIQARLYSQAGRAEALRPDLLFFARTAARHEEEHVVALAALVEDAGDPPRPDLWQVAADDAAFAHMAVRLEDLTVRTLNGIAGELSPAALETTARVASVDARHAAWVRALVGVTPSHHVFDRGRTRDEVAAALTEAGLDPDLVP
jgi:hypothetical protein